MMFEKEFVVENDENFYRIILPRTEQKPLEFYGKLIYSNDTQMNRYISIYQTSREVVTTRYVIYHIWGHGGYQKNYNVYTFDDAKELDNFISNNNLPDFAITANELLKINIKTGNCETEQLI